MRGFIVFDLWSSQAHHLASFQHSTLYFTSFIILFSIFHLLPFVFRSFTLFCLAVWCVCVCVRSELTLSCIFHTFSFCSFTWLCFVFFRFVFSILFIFPFQFCLYLAYSFVSIFNAFHYNIIFHGFWHNTLVMRVFSHTHKKSNYYCNEHDCMDWELVMIWCILVSV